MPEHSNEPPTWNLTLGRQGLELRAGRHLHLSVSLVLLAWLLTVSGAASVLPLLEHLRP
ncbi:hypothetical protein ACFCYX_38485 [Streptomyces populi]|uniref:hypothetical protein n=1 Tax=Streptomyces populi TaxID=2058924 RepID=UPI0013A69FDD|nr:hypothetical protein [Streptomyces populi]